MLIKLVPSWCQAGAKMVKLIKLIKLVPSWLSWSSLCGWYQVGAILVNLVK